MAQKSPKKVENKPGILNVYRLTKAYNIYPIFQNLSFQVNQGEKIALVGVNGAGKSTLLKLIAGLEQPDSGEIVLARNCKVAYLPQEASFESSKTLYTEMLEVFAELRLMQAEIEQLELQMAEPGFSEAEWDNLLERYGELTRQFERAGGYEYETRIRQVLNGLNFSKEMWEQPINQFSGGQKTRAALARTLISSPDLLLLDEPTNHLDLATLEWLESFLANWPGTLLIISHDRSFLDKVVARVLDLSFGRLEDYPGNYSKYLRLRKERRERAAKEYEAQQVHIAKTEEFIRRFRAGQRAKEAQGRQKLLNRLERVERPRDNARLRISFQSDLQSGRLVMAAQNLAVGWQERKGPQVLFRAPDLDVERGERVAIIGPNGCGKSSFLKTIMGELAPLEGTVQFGVNVQVGYYAQSHEGLNWHRTVLEEIRQTSPMSEEDARTYLGRFLFSGDDVFKRVGDLSGGERSRVALAKLILAKANFLVLDEPTNHLDINARESLEELLSEYNGTILFVSHDRYFIDALATQVWELDRSGLTTHRGNFSAYQEWLERATQPGQTAKPASQIKLASA
ncbi:MAG TPA: ABC-F family ATP-binding cassette domain-containing protein [Chloroflexia bacterium]|nr:ABC-F family ATP-binding cassette domain-containing protein [Chloroflexia bacterium]